MTLAGGVVGLLWLIRRGANDCPIVVAAAIGDGRAVVACRSSYRDHVKPDLSLWVISLEDGRALRRVQGGRPSEQWIKIVDRLFLAGQGFHQQKVAIPSSDPVLIIHPADKNAGFKWAQGAGGHQPGG